MKIHQDWICSVKWVQATPAEGAWLWTLWQVDAVEGQDEPKLTKLEDGVTLTKLGVYWNVWRECRKRGFRFRPNIRGKIN